MDICNSRGTEVCKWAMTGQDNPRPSISTYPRQDKPAPHIWTTWRRLLRLTYSKTKECRLDRPLRKWYTGRLNQIWDTVINLTTALLYVWTTCKVQVVYEKQGRGHKRFRYLRPHHTASFPRRCVPISHLSGRILHLLQLCNNDSPPLTPTSTTNRTPAHAPRRTHQHPTLDHCSSDMGWTSHPWHRRLCQK